jgi:hypothetical protein
VFPARAFLFTGIIYAPIAGDELPERNFEP